MYSECHNPPLKCPTVPTENLSKYLDHFLKPIVQIIPSYIQDTTHFLRELMKHRRSIKSGSFLVTMDVCSLYTNIPHDEGIMYNLSALIQFYGDQLPLPAKYLQQMFVLILKHNYFTFNNRYYLQTHGTAMEATFAPNYANIFMANIEDMLMSRYTVSQNQNFGKDLSMTYFLYGRETKTPSWIFSIQPIRFMTVSNLNSTILRPASTS